MTPTSPPTGGTNPSAPRPPARNKSSSALSTHTLRSLSSTTSSGKPRRNKSSSSLAGSAHHHSAGHHPVSFAHHRKNSHGAHAMRRQNSASGGSQRKPPGGGPFGLGMTSMPAAEGGDHGGEQGEGQEADDAQDGATGTQHLEQVDRPDLRQRRTSSSSTATVVASDRGGRSSERGQSRSRSRVREEQEQEEQGEPAHATAVEGTEQHGDHLSIASGSTSHGRGKSRLPSSATSTSDWECATDSPLAIGKKLPDVQREFQPEEQSGLGQALDEQGDEPVAQPDEPQRKPPARPNGKKAKFSLGASEDQDEPDEVDRQAAANLDDDRVEPAFPGTAPAAASSPSATAAIPAMPAILRDVELTEPLAVPPKPEPQGEQEAAGLAPPAPPSAPQHLSPPDTSPVGGGSDGEPSLAAAAQPELAFPNKPPSNPPSNPTSQPPSRKASASQLFRPGETLKPNSPPRPPSPIRPSAQRARPVRKSSNASIMSGASTRSHVPRPAPQFRRSASGAPAFVDRGATVRAELASPGPDSGSGSESQRREVVGNRARVQHQRGESVSSVRSLRQAAEATTGPPRRAQTLGRADAQHMRVSEPPGSALAKLGTIAAAQASRSTTPLSSSAGASSGGALTHAKRSASGYFNALRGFTGLPAGASTPPLSPSAGTAGQRPIPGASSSQLSSSYGRGSRVRSSPSPRAPALVVKFVEPAPPAPPPPPPQSDAPAPSSSPPTQRPLSAQHRTASSASLGPMSRTQQKALLARDAPQAASHPSALAPPAQGPGVPSGLTPAQQQFLLLQQQRAAASAAGAGASSASSASPSPAPQAAAAVANGMQKWAFGLVREAERIERQYRAVEKWRDPLGESLERVLVVRQRARRRREDDREKVRAAIAAQQAATGGATGGKGSGAGSAAGSGTATPEHQVARVQQQAQRQTGSGAASPSGPPASSKGKQRGAFDICSFQALRPSR